MLSLRLAWRNLWRNKRRTWLTAMAIIFSNVLLVFMISLQFGSYRMMIDNTLRAFSGHLQIQHAGYNANPRMRETVADVASLAAVLRQDLPNAGVSARAEAFALASSEERSFGIQVVGVQPESEPGVSTLPDLLTAGRFLTDSDAAEIVLGSALARNLKVDIGDEVTLLGSGMDGSFAAGVVRVVGIYESGMPDLDRSLSEVPLGYFQETFAMGSDGHSIVIGLPDLGSVPETLNAVLDVVAAHDELEVLDWQQLHPGLRQAIMADFSSAWFMYGVLVVLVALSVLNTQLMSVLERTREFGVIMALGVTPRRMAALVLLETALMSLIGLVLGVLLGALLTLYFYRYGFHYPGMEEMAQRFNLPARIYPSLTLLSGVLGPSVVFVFSVLAALYPSLRLFRLRPIEAMRAA